MIETALNNVTKAKNGIQLSGSFTFKLLWMVYFEFSCKYVCLWRTKCIPVVLWFVFITKLSSMKIANLGMFCTYTCYSYCESENMWKNQA